VLRAALAAAGGSREAQQRIQVEVSGHGRQRRREGPS
jgi:hypothetical protein